MSKVTLSYVAASRSPDVRASEIAPHAFVSVALSWLLLPDASGEVASAVLSVLDQPQFCHGCVSAPSPYTVMSAASAFAVLRVGSVGASLVSSSAGAEHPSISERTTG